MTKHTKPKGGWILGILICTLLGGLLVSSARAAPSGGTLSVASTDSGPTIQPGSSAAARGTISTVTLSAKQQDQHWKGYVGNVTGVFTLDDSSNYTLYNWSISSITGEIYASRNGSLTFSTVACANATIITTEQTVLNMSLTDPDTISRTFNSTSHASTTVAGTSLSGCNSTALYVNDTYQLQNSTAIFQEFLIQDSGANLIYVSRINDNQLGFNTGFYDFQMIVGESHVQSALTSYFYVELG